MSVASLPRPTCSPPRNRPTRADHSCPFFRPPPERTPALHFFIFYSPLPSTLVPFRVNFTFGLSSSLYISAGHERIYPPYPGHDFLFSFSPNQYPPESLLVTSTAFLLSIAHSHYACPFISSSLASSPFIRCLTEVYMVPTYTTHRLTLRRPPLIPQNCAHAHYTSARMRPNSRFTSSTSLVCPLLIILFTGV